MQNRKAALPQRDKRTCLVDRQLWRALMGWNISTERILPERKAESTMKKTTLALMLALSITAGAPRLLARARASRRIAVEDSVINPSLPSTGIAVGVLTSTTLAPLSDLFVSVWIQTAFSFGDARMSGNTLQVPVYRVRNGNWCLTQTLSVPANPNELTDYALDLRSFGPGDSVQFEDRTAYQVRVNALVMSTTKQYFVGTFGPATEPQIRASIAGNCN